MGCHVDDFHLAEGLGDIDTECGEAEAALEPVGRDRGALHTVATHIAGDLFPHTTPADNDIVGLAVSKHDPRSPTPGDRKRDQNEGRQAPDVAKDRDQENGEDRSQDNSFEDSEASGQGRVLPQRCFDIKAGGEVAGEVAAISDGYRGKVRGVAIRGTRRIVGGDTDDAEHASGKAQRFDECLDALQRDFHRSPRQQAIEHPQFVAGSLESEVPVLDDVDEREDGNEDDDRDDRHTEVVEDCGGVSRLSIPPRPSHLDDDRRAAEEDGSEIQARDHGPADEVAVALAVDLLAGGRFDGHASALCIGGRSTPGGRQAGTNAFGFAQRQHAERHFGLVRFARDLDVDVPHVERAVSEFPDQVDLLDTIGREGSDVLHEDARADRQLVADETVGHPQIFEDSPANVAYENNREANPIAH